MVIPSAVEGSALAVIPRAVEGSALLAPCATMRAGAEAGIKNGGLKGIKADWRDARATTKAFEGAPNEGLDVAHSKTPLLVNPLHPP